MDTEPPIKWSDQQHLEETSTAPTISGGLFVGQADITSSLAIKGTSRRFGLAVDQEEGNKTEEEDLAQTKYGLNSKDREVDNKKEENGPTQVAESGLNSGKWRKGSSSGDIEVIGQWLVTMGYILLAINRHSHEDNNAIVMSSMSGARCLLGYPDMLKLGMIPKNFPMVENHNCGAFVDMEKRVFPTRCPQSGGGEVTVNRVEGESKEENTKKTKEESMKDDSDLHGKDDSDLHG